MAYVTSYLQATNSLAGFRAWGSGISTAIAAAGLVRTADTGQIDWATVTVPVANSAAGYEIYRFDDALQATKPVFIKVEYGSGVTAASTPQMWVTTGSATDGAGNLGSAAGTLDMVTLRRQMGPGAAGETSPGTSSNCYISSDGFSLGMLLWPSLGTVWGGMFFLVERMRDMDGTPNGDGYMTIWSYSGNLGYVYMYQKFYDTAVAQPGLSGSAIIPADASSTVSTCLIGTDLYPLPVFTGFTRKLQGPSKMVVVAGKTDLPNSGTYNFTMTHYGESALWVPAGPGGTTDSPGWGNWCAGAATAGFQPILRVG